MLRVEYDTKCKKAVYVCHGQKTVGVRKNKRLIKVLEILPRPCEYVVSLQNCGVKNRKGSETSNHTQY